ncbi:MAG: hypothetical protein KDA75_05115 [Planctomycetaceae bacterium]|nr:hypothetical protein [Planctomycetaceae bacterium]
MARSSFKLASVAVIWIAGVLLLYSLIAPTPVYRLPDNEVATTVSPDGRYLVSASRPDEVVLGERHLRGPLVIRDACTGHELRTLLLDSGHDVVQITQLSVERRYVLASFPDYCVAWNLETGDRVLHEPGCRFVFSCKPPEAPQDVALLLSVLDPSAVTKQARVRLLDIERGHVLSEFGTVQLMEGFAGGPSLAIASNFEFVVTFDPSKNLKEQGVDFQVWDPFRGSLVGVIQEEFSPRAWAIGGDENLLWLVFGPSASPDGPHVIELHCWNLRDQKLVSRIRPEAESEAESALSAAYQVTIKDRGVLRVDFAGGTFLFDTADDDLRYLGAEGMGTVVSPDGTRSAYESGVVIDAAPPFIYQKRERRLTVRRNEGGEVLFQSPAIEEVTAVSQFKPMAFTADGGSLVYQQFDDSVWGRVRALAADLLDFRIPRFDIRPSEFRCVELETSRSWTIAHVGSQPMYRASFLPGDVHVKIGNNVYRTDGGKPWLISLCLPTAFIGAYWGLRRWWTKGRAKTATCDRDMTSTRPVMG